MGTSMLDRWQIGVAAVAALVAACWAVWIGSPAFPLDDAYISQHSAEALLRNEEWRFVGSAPLQGVTSIAHVAVLALFGLLMPIPIAQMLLACLAFIAYCKENWKTGDYVILTVGCEHPERWTDRSVH